MQCCVPSCGNGSDNASASAGTGITFHELPSDVHLRAAWLRAVSIQDRHLPHHPMVCSQHCIDVDFYETKNCQREFRSAAIPLTELMTTHKAKLNHLRLGDLSAPVEPVVADVATVVKKEDNLTWSTNDMRFISDDDNHNSNNDYMSDEEYSNMSTGASCTDVTDQIAETQDHVKCESITFGCTFCFEDFVQEDNYIEHMRMHLQNAGGDAACGAAASCSWDSLVLDNKSRTQRLNDDPPPSAESAQSFVAPPSARLAANKDNKVRATVEAAAIQKSEQILETSNQSSQSDTKPFTDINRFTNCVVLLYDIFKEANKDVLDESLCERSVAPLTARLATNKDNKVRATEEAAAIQKSEQILETSNQSSQSDTKPFTDINRFTNCVVVLRDILKEAKKDVQVRTRTGGKCYSCDLCRYKSTRRDHLIVHIRTHTGEKPYSCDICNYKCAQTGQLINHKLIHTGVKPYSCDICHYKCAQRGRLMSHKKTHTGEKPYSCDLCHFKCAAKRSLLVHMTTHTGEKPYSCEICSNKFRLKSDISRHMATHTGVKPKSCDLCHYKCASNRDLVRHKRTHTGEKPYSCEICSSKFTLKHALFKHMRTHSGVKPYVCEVCNFKCSDRSSFNRHSRTHTGETPYSCKLCSYKCTQSGALSRHMMTHTGERPHGCELCEYKGATKIALLRHMKSHTGEKPYSCEMCSYKCAEKRDLVRHVRIHTGEKPYACKICNRTFTRRGHLKSHMRTHTGDKPYSCDICQHRCAEKGNLITHIKKHISGKSFVPKKISKKG